MAANKHNYRESISCIHQDKLGYPTLTNSIQIITENKKRFISYITG